jgi:hypothetical protein
MTKICPGCKTEKSLEDFHIDKTQKSGRVSKCKPCVRERTLSANAKENKKIYNRQRSRKSYSGFTQEEYEAKLKEQNYRCAICNSETHNGINWCADHCHSTGTKRGVLCYKCNVGLGYFKDNVESLENAIMYLNKYRENINEVSK